VTLKFGYESLNVIGTDPYRSAADDFLFMFHSNQGLSITVSEMNGDFGRKSQNSPCTLRPADGGSL